MVICQGLPVGNQHFGKNVILNLGIHFKADEGGCIAGCLGNQNVGYGKTDHCSKGGEQLSGLMPGDNVYQILGNQTGNQRNAGACNSKECIQDHGFPVTPSVLIDPERLPPHFLQCSLSEMFPDQLELIFHGAPPVGQSLPG